MSIPIIEIFNSIEGEGARSGKLCTFVRTAGCNLRCSFCDTTYSYDIAQAQQYSVEQLVREIENIAISRTLTLTGGEPLLHTEVCECLIPWLLERGYDINIETNGSLSLSRCVRHKHDKLMYTMDWKSPSSGMNDHMCVDNLSLLQPKDVLKFVVGSQDDLQEMKSILCKYAPLAQIFVSPVFSAIEPVEIVEFMKDNRLQNVRIQLQLHKIIWNKDERGV